MKSIVFVWFLAVSAAAGAAPAGNPDAAAIEVTIASWDAAYDAGDLRKYEQVLAPGFLSFSLGASSGGQDKSVTAENLRNVFLKYSARSTDDVQEIAVSAKMAYVRSNFTITLTPKSGGKTQQYSGYAMEVWEKAEDGQWRITRYMGIPNQVDCPR